MKMKIGERRQGAAVSRLLLVGNLDQDEPSFAFSRQIAGWASVPWIGML